MNRASYVVWNPPSHMHIISGPDVVQYFLSDFSLSIEQGPAIIASSSPDLYFISQINDGIFCFPFSGNQFGNYREQSECQAIPGRLPISRMSNSSLECLQYS